MPGQFCCIDFDTKKETLGKEKRERIQCKSGKNATKRE
jgi:hypothetical protein